MCRPDPSTRSPAGRRGTRAAGDGHALGPAALRRVVVHDDDALAVTGHLGGPFRYLERILVSADCRPTIMIAVGRAIAAETAIPAGKTGRLWAPVDGRRNPLGTHGRPSRGRPLLIGCVSAGGPPPMVGDAVPQRSGRHHRLPVSADRARPTGPSRRGRPAGQADRSHTREHFRDEFIRLSDSLALKGKSLHRRKIPDRRATVDPVVAEPRGRVGRRRARRRPRPGPRGRHRSGGPAGRTRDRPRRPHGRRALPAVYSVLRPIRRRSGQARTVCRFRPGWTTARS